MVVLSIDQASKTCGYSVLEDGELIDYGKKDFKEDNVVERISKIKKWLNDLIKKHKPDVVGLEDIQYQRNPLTHKILAELLGVLENHLYEKNITYFIVPSTRWKSTCGVKGRKRVEQKANAQRFVTNKFGIKVGEDTSDAICIGWHLSKK